VNGRLFGKRLLAAVFLLAAVGGACARRSVPTAEEPTPQPPALGGHAVLVLPVQPAPWVTAPADAVLLPRAADAEIAFWLQDRGARVRWVFPPELERFIDRSPGLDIRLRALAVERFRSAEVKRIGDPLYGDLRRLAGLADARFALVPVAGAFVPAEGGGVAAEIAAALIDTFDGSVRWFGVVRGSPGARDDPARLASVAQALARALVR